MIIKTFQENPLKNLIYKKCASKNLELEKNASLIYLLPPTHLSLPTAMGAMLFKQLPSALACFHEESESLSIAACVKEIFPSRTFDPPFSPWRSFRVARCQESLTWLDMLR